MEPSEENKKRKKNEAPEAEQQDHAALTSAEDPSDRSDSDASDVAADEVKNSFGFLAKFYLIFLAGVVLVGITGVAIAYSLSGDLPSIEEIYNVEPAVISKIYDTHGTLLQKYAYENRSLVPYETIPQHLVQALIATEDAGFYNHWGVDSRGVARAVLRNVVSGFGSQGGSTITQQLSRMLFLNRDPTLKRKIKEALTALKIERTYSKNEILEMYFNTYYFGHGAYGIETAARTYFNKNAENLSVEESALLVAILNAPARFSPLRHPDRAFNRRNYVLNRMQNEGYISEAMRDSLKAIQLKLDLSQDLPGEAPYFTEMVRQHLVEQHGEDFFYTAGLTVQTTLDLELQKVTEASMQSQLESIQARIERNFSPDDEFYTIPAVDSSGAKIFEYKQIQGAFVGIDNHTGDIITLIGGKDFSTWKFNRAVQAKRQPGSSFKPFVYTAAIKEGYHTCDIIFDTPIVLTIPGSDEWSPNNFDEKFMGPMSIRKGLARSRNLVAIKLLQKVGVRDVIAVAKQMGITSPLTPNAALAIGTSEVSPLEIASAYSVFANGGVRVEPRFIKSVTDRYGNVIEHNRVSPRRSVLDPAVTYIVVSMMQSVMDEWYGTGHKARVLGFQRPAAGKTGTSDDFADNWYVGYTPQITACCWVGFDDKTSIGKNQTGATNALPIWTDFMIAAHENLAVENFTQPNGIVRIRICTETGEKATRYCTNVREEVFLNQYPVEGVCHVHTGSFGL